MQTEPLNIQEEVIILALALSQSPALLLYRQNFVFDLALLEQLGLSRELITIVVPSIVITLNLPVGTLPSPLDLAEVQIVLGTLPAEFQALIFSLSTSLLQVQRMTRANEEKVTIVTKIMKENDYMPTINL